MTWFYLFFAVTVAASEVMLFLALKSESEISIANKAAYLIGPALSAATVIVFYSIINYGQISDSLISIGIFSTSVVVIINSIYATWSIRGKSERKITGNHFIRTSFVYAAAIYMILWIL